MPLVGQIALGTAAKLECGLIPTRARLGRSGGGGVIDDGEGRSGVERAIGLIAPIGRIGRREGRLAKVCHRLSRADTHLAHGHRGHIRRACSGELRNAHNAEPRGNARFGRKVHREGLIGGGQPKGAQRLPRRDAIQRLPLHHHLLNRIRLRNGRHRLEGDRADAIGIDRRFNPRPVIVAIQRGALHIQQLRTGAPVEGRANRATVDTPAIGPKSRHPGHRAQVPLKVIAQGHLRSRVHPRAILQRGDAHPKPPVGEVHLAPVILDIGNAHERAQTIAGCGVPLIRGLALEQRGNHRIGRLEVSGLQIVDCRTQIDALPARRIVRLPQGHIRAPRHAGAVVGRARGHASVVRGTRLRHRVEVGGRRCRAACGGIRRIALEDDATGKGRLGPLMLAVHQARGRSYHAHTGVVARARHRHGHLHAHIARGIAHRRSGSGIGRISRVCARINQRKRIRHAVLLGHPLRTCGGTPKESRHHGRQHQKLQFSAHTLNPLFLRKHLRHPIHTTLTVSGVWRYRAK